MRVERLFTGQLTLLLAAIWVGVLPAACRSEITDPTDVTMVDGDPSGQDDGQDDGSTGQDSVPGEDPPPSPLPPPPPPPPPSGSCDIIADASDGNPNGVVNSASPGQTVCLAGTFTLAHGQPMGMARPGVNTQLFDVTASGTPTALVTVDGTSAIVQGDFAANENLNLSVSGSNVRLTGFTVRTGFIVVQSGASNVYIENNDVAEAVFPPGNAGSIRTLGGTTDGPTDVFVRNNHVHDQYACNGDTSTSCPGLAKVDWQGDSDLEHHGGVTTSGVNFGLFVVEDNTIERVTAIFYLKRNSTSDTQVLNNSFRDAQRLGRCRHSNMTFSGNTQTNVGGSSQTSDRCVTN